MLEIVKGRSWTVAHTVLDNVDGPASDLNHIASWKSQIREKTAVKVDGEWVFPLVADVTVSRTGSMIYLMLTREQTNSLKVGDFLIDLVGSTAAGNDESFLNPEPVKITLRPTIL